MRVRQPDRTLSESLALYEAHRWLELKKIRRELRRLEWAMRWRRIKNWFRVCKH